MSTFLWIGVAVIAVFIFIAILAMAGEKSTTIELTNDKVVVAPPPTVTPPKQLPPPAEDPAPDDATGDEVLPGSPAGESEVEAPPQVNWATIAGWNLVHLYPHKNVIEYGDKPSHVECDETCRGDENCVAWTYWGADGDVLPGKCYGSTSHRIQKTRAYDTTYAGMKRPPNWDGNLQLVIDREPQEFPKFTTPWPGYNFFAPESPLEIIDPDKLPDGVYKFHNKKSWQECDAACTFHPDCVAYTFYPRGEHQGRCLGTSRQDYDADSGYDTVSGQIGIADKKYHENIPDPPHYNSNSGKRLRHGTLYNQRN